MNIGHIYKITNTINNKCYIGQTTQGVERRWQEHKNASKNENGKNYKHPLYMAFRRYGLENFKFEIIEECSIEELDEKEIKWTKFYDSYKNGYNITLGGGGYRIHDLNENEVIEKYKELGVLKKVADQYSCTPNVIRGILKKHNVKLRSLSEIAQDEARTTICKDNDGNIIREFTSIAEAAKWITGANTRDDYRKMHACITRAIRKGYEYGGYYWSSTVSVKKHNVAPKPKVKGKETEKKICPLCGNKMDKKSKKCATCENKLKHNQFIKEKEEKYGLTREILKDEIRTTSFLKLSKKYGVSNKAICKWCKKYGLPYRKSDINSYTDEEWEQI